MARRYSMKKRAQAQGKTRLRILEATVRMHAARGIVATKPAEIAARADVSLTTFYKHFPSQRALVEACTAHAATLVPAPDPAAVKALKHPASRIAEAVRALFDFYAAREHLLYTGRTEERLVEELRPAMARLRALRNAFVDASLHGLGKRRETISAVAALMDFWAWRTLRRDVGLEQAAAVSTVTVAIERIAGARETKSAVSKSTEEE